jgi:PAS domain S-box-containing protein
MKFEALRGSDGRQTGAFLTGTDITERVREQRRLAEAEAARREADALYRAYFENTPEALFIIGVEPDGGFIVEEINPAHEAGVGLRLEDIRGKRVEDILPADIAKRVRETYRHVVETGRVLQYRERFDLTGEPQHWDTSLVPMRDQDGRIFRLIGSSRNVTRQVVAEEALRQSQKMESMGQLTGGVAHDFNNLLTPIVAALDLLQRRGVGGEREQRLIAGAAQSAERAKVLVQRLLAFARRQPLQPVPVDVAQLVDGMKALVASTTGPQIALVVEVAGDVPPAMADPNQLEMALLNLAVNARDAMPNGGTLRIAASAHRVKAGEDAKLAPGRYVRVAVADTGTGMDAETLARAVEPFFSTKGIGKGTGLGLSMVHGLASQLGGALDITSAPGAGTTIELWLPQAADAPEAQAPAHEAAPAPSQDAALQNTALLVDDEEFVRMSTADMLGDLGYRVVEAASAEEALEMISNGGRIDLVVTDHLMPGMTGTELARNVHVSWPDLPVLVVSGYSEVDGIASDLPRLTKPFRKDDLAASLAGLTTPRAS